ncbi:hypothetical protein WICPIJ_006109 [Wickerhamomyces pijperi]|uniref:Uncharacterized protein n=1 Tax=Wickerhamomyces pijperi TaxID=599730 RepID=A0A9P8TKH9_WICPI|nr:hypothetical protein WICPIJ_006109 [Wickerhamomyces pijperi]
MNYNRPHDTHSQNGNTTIESNQMANGPLKISSAVTGKRKPISNDISSLIAQLDSDLNSDDEDATSTSRTNTYGTEAGPQVSTQKEMTDGASADGVVNSSRNNNDPKEKNSPLQRPVDLQPGSIDSLETPSHTVAHDQDPSITAILRHPIISNTNPPPNSNPNTSAQEQPLHTTPTSTGSITRPLPQHPAALVNRPRSQDKKNNQNEQRSMSKTKLVNELSALDKMYKSVVSKPFIENSERLMHRKLQSFRTGDNQPHARLTAKPIMDPVVSSEYDPRRGRSLTVTLFSSKVLMSFTGSDGRSRSILLGVGVGATPSLAQKKAYFNAIQFSGLFDIMDNRDDSLGPEFLHDLGENRFTFLFHKIKKGLMRPLLFRDEREFDMFDLRDCPPRFELGRSNNGQSRNIPRHPHRSSDTGTGSAVSEPKVDQSILPPPSTPSHFTEKSKLIIEEIQLLQYCYPFRYDLLHAFSKLASASSTDRDSSITYIDYLGSKMKLCEKLKDYCYFVQVTNPFYTPETKLVYTSIVVLNRYIIGCGASFNSQVEAEEMAAYMAMNASDWFGYGKQMTATDVKRNSGESIWFDRFKRLCDIHLKKLEDPHRRNMVNRNFESASVTASVMKSPDTDYPRKPPQYRDGRHVEARDIAIRVRDMMKVILDADMDAFIPWIKAICGPCKVASSKMPNLKNLKMTLVKKMQEVKPMLIDLPIIQDTGSFTSYYTTIVLIGDIIAGVGVSEDGAEHSKEIAVWNTIYTCDVFQFENISRFVSRIDELSMDRIYFLLSKILNELQGTESSRLSQRRKQQISNLPDISKWSFDDYREFSQKSQESILTRGKSDEVKALESYQFLSPSSDQHSELLDLKKLLSDLAIMGNIVNLYPFKKNSAGNKLRSKLGPKNVQIFPLFDPFVSSSEETISSNSSSDVYSAVVLYGGVILSVGSSLQSNLEAMDAAAMNALYSVGWHHNLHKLNLTDDKVFSLAIVKLCNLAFWTCQALIGHTRPLFEDFDGIDPRVFDMFEAGYRGNLSIDQRCGVSLEFWEEWWLPDEEARRIEMSEKRVQVPEIGQPLNNVSVQRTGQPMGLGLIQDQQLSANGTSSLAIGQNPSLPIHIPISQQPSSVQSQLQQSPQPQLQQVLPIMERSGVISNQVLLNGANPELHQNGGQQPSTVVPQATGQQAIMGQQQQYYPPQAQHMLENTKGNQSPVFVNGMPEAASPQYINPQAPTQQMPLPQVQKYNQFNNIPSLSTPPIGEYSFMNGNGNVQMNQYQHSGHQQQRIQQYPTPQYQIPPMMTNGTQQSYQQPTHFQPLNRQVNDQTGQQDVAQDDFFFKRSSHR